MKGVFLTEGELLSGNISFPAVHWGGPLPLFLEVWMESGVCILRVLDLTELLRMLKSKVGLYVLISWRPSNNPLQVLCALFCYVPFVAFPSHQFKVYWSMRLRLWLYGLLHAYTVCWLSSHQFKVYWVMTEMKEKALVGELYLSWERHWWV